MARKNGVQIIPKERSPWMSMEPAGFRDIYWCSSLNEPYFLSYRDGGPYCCNCDQAMNLPSDEYHIFIGHAIKPY